MRYLSCPLRRTSLSWKSTQQAFKLFLFRKPLSKMQNNFSYKSNKHCSFQMDYNCYPLQRRDFQQQIVTPTSAPDISGLTLRQFNDLYPRSSCLGYEQQPYSWCQPQIVFSNNMYHHNKLNQPMDHLTGKLCY